VLPGKEDELRRFYEEVDGARRDDYERSEQRLGITKEVAWIEATDLRTRENVLHLIAQRSSNEPSKTTPPKPPAAAPPSSARHRRSVPAQLAD
jgi:hypothetical protein